MNRGRLVKGTSFLMTLCLVLTLLPTLSFATTESSRTLYYSSTDKKLHYDSVTGADASDISGWSVIDDTLTLTDFNFSTTADCALVMSGTLVIEGTNSLVSANTGKIGVNTKATLLSYGSLTIKGDGTLNIKTVGDAHGVNPERCIFTYEDLTLRGNVTVTASAKGNSGVQTVNPMRALYMYDSAVLNTNSDSPHSSWTVVTTNLGMYGGKIYASSESTSGGGGIWLTGAFLAMTEGEIYAKCKSSSGTINAVAFYGTIPSGISVSGSADFNSSSYTTGGVLTKLNANGTTGAYYRAVEADTSGNPRLGSALTNIKISPSAATDLCSLKVSYYHYTDGVGALMDSETIIVQRNTTVNESYLKSIPSGYKLKDSFSYKVTATTGGVSLTIIKTDDYTLTVNYINESGTQVGTQKIVVKKDTDVTDKDFSIPKGYEFKGSYNNAVAADATISVNVVRVDYVLTVNYVEEGGKQVSTQKITVQKDTVVSQAYFSIPKGYEYKGSYSITLTKDETISITVVRTDYILTVNYVDESGIKVGSEDVYVLKNSNITVGILSIPTGYRLKESFSKEVTKDETILLVVVKTSTDFIASTWAQAELKKADSYGLIPDGLRYKDLTKPISRVEFAAVSVRTYEALSGLSAQLGSKNPFTDTSDIDVLKAYNLGITNGTSATTYSPYLNLNREEAATMLTRVFKRVTMSGWTIADDSKFPLSYTKPSAFADDASISAWAKDSVYFLVANDIIKGVGSNLFAPKNTTAAQEIIGYASTTREQALIIALRMVQNL